MAITYPTVQVGDSPYPALTTLADADAYLAAEPDADAYRGGDETQRSRWVVGASRALLRRSYVPGTLDGPDVPVALAQAAALLAAAIAAGYDPSRPTSQQVRRQRAGTAEQDFFYDSVTVPMPFPLPVWELIRFIDAGSGDGVAGSIANGTCKPSSFVDDFSTGYAYGSDDGEQFRRTWN